MEKEYERLKYETRNFIAKKLIQCFHKTIIKILLDLDYKFLHEVGCGDGYNMQVITSVKKAQYSGSDIEEGALVLAKQRNPKVNFLKTSVYNLPFKENSFDMVVASQMLEHLDRPQDALQEIKRVTKKYCLLSVPNEPIWRILNMLRGEHWNNLGNFSEHINHWSKKAFINLINQYFEIDVIKTPLPWIIIVAHI